MREAFEAWAQKYGYNTSTHSNGDGWVWLAWQAAVSWEREECAKIADADWAWADCAKAIRARGEK